MTTHGLSGVSETLLIPLAGRATAQQLNADLGFDDPFARETVRRIGFDPARFSHDRITMRAAVVRAMAFDAIAREFLGRNPGAIAIAVAAGLDARFHRVDDGRVEWVDVDLEPVVALKRELMPPGGRYRQVAASITNPDWLDTAGWRPGRPTIVFAEGILMYLEPAEVRAFVVQLGDRFSPGDELAFDYLHPIAMVASGLHPSVGRTSARCHWGTRDPAIVHTWTQRWQLAEVVPVVERIGGLAGFAARAARRLGHPFYSVARFRRVAAQAGERERTHP